MKLEFANLKKDAFYFSHDSNARNDVKMVKLRRKFGPAGVGIYWMIIECLREQSEYELSVNSIPDLAYDFHVDENDIQSVINDFGLFEITEDSFYSRRLKRSMEQFNEKKKKLSEAGKKGNQKRWNESPPDPKVISTLSPPDPNPIALKKRKEKKREENKIKESVLEYVSLTQDEIEKLKNEFGDPGYNWMINKLNYSKGASGRTYKSDYMAIRKWVVDEYQKQNPTNNSKPRFVA